MLLDEGKYPCIHALHCILEHGETGVPPKLEVPANKLVDLDEIEAMLAASTFKEIVDYAHAEEAPVGKFVYIHGVLAGLWPEAHPYL
jgi:hypothetical protein